MLTPTEHPRGPASALHYCYCTYFDALRPIFDLAGKPSPALRLQNEMLAYATSISQMAGVLLDDLLAEDQLRQELLPYALRLREVFAETARVMDFTELIRARRLGDEEMCQMGAALEEAALLEGTPG